MDAPPFALVMARRSAEYLALSARPDAPVVEPRSRRHAVRTRTALAHVLARWAVALEPAPRRERAGGHERGVGHAAT